MEATSVETLVRDEVRARGIDPLCGPDAVRRLVDAAMQESLVEGPVDDVASMGTHVPHSIARFGPLQCSRRSHR